MRRSAALAVALVAAASVPLVVASAKPPKTAPAPKPEIDLAAKPAPIVFGGGTVLSGRVKGKNNVGVAVTLREAPYPFKVYRSVAKVTSGKKGVFSITRAPTVNTIYRAVAGAKFSRNVLVNVRIKISVHVSDTTPRAGRLVRFKGRACPPKAGGVVRIQRMTLSGRFHTVARTRLKAATRCTVYSRRVRIRRDGTYRTSTDDASHLAGRSRLVAIDAHR